MQGLVPSTLQYFLRPTSITHSALCDRNTNYAYNNNRNSKPLEGLLKEMLIKHSAFTLKIILIKAYIINNLCNKVTICCPSLIKQPTDVNRIVYSLKTWEF